MITKLCGWALVLFAGGAAVAAADSKNAVVVETRGELYVVAVPASRAELRFARGAFLVEPAGPREGATRNPRYFGFRDAKEHVLFTGWVEPARIYPGFDKVWTRDRARFNRGPFKIEREERKTLGDWDCVQYYVRNDANPQFAFPHLRACCVKEGAWYDVHLSVYVPNGEMTVLEAVLRGLIIQRKPGTG